jgi:hypothetical protein
MANVINATSTGNGGLVSTGDDSGILNIQTNETTAITVDASQNVGIGTASPSGKFDVSGTVVASGLNARITNTDSDASARAAIQFKTGASASVWQVFTRNNQLTFGVNAVADYMTLVSTGELVVGGTTAGGVGTSIAAPDSGGIYLNTATTGLRNAIRFVNPNGTVGSIQTSGSLTSYNVSSDYRLKENIVPLTGALAKITQLKPSVYNYKADPTTIIEGFIAHELQSVIPNAVSGEKDAVDEDGNPEYQGVDVSFLVATLTAAIQELKAINDTQAETINALTARIVALEQA